MQEINNLPDFEPIDVLEEIQEVETTEEITDEVKEIEYSENADSTAIAFFKELQERGYVVENEDTKFDGTWETLDTYLETFPQQVLNQVVQSLPEVSKDIMRYIATAGENITKDDLKNFFNTYFEQETSVSIDSMDDAREYLKTYYSQELKLKDKVINTMLDQLEEDEELIDEAKSILEKTNSVKKTESLIQAKEEENLQAQRQMQEKMQNIKNELLATQWKPERIQKVQTILSGSNLSNTIQDIVNSPKALVQLADLLTYYDVKSKTINLEHFKNQAATQAAKSIKDRIEQEMSGSASLKTSTNKNNQVNNFDNLIPVD